MHFHFQNVYLAILFFSQLKFYNNIINFNRRFSIYFLKTYSFYLSHYLIENSSIFFYNKYTNIYYAYTCVVSICKSFFFFKLNVVHLIRNIY